ncbi:hypothetical protein LTR85_011300 [Meristemomyces frigidus]|nr:hypothetical protein LTR85_011300 [Meristemomyces frigidus]
MDLSDIVSSSLALYLHILLWALSYLPILINTKPAWCAGAVYAATYFLFGTESIDEAPTKGGEPPSRAYFFEHCYKHLLALIYDDCPICWKQPAGPVELKPCGHIYCDGCIKRWFGDGQKSCPYCMRTLWVERNSRIEVCCKLLVATTHLSEILTIVVLLFARDLNRSFVVLATFSLIVNSGYLTLYWEAKKKSEGRWWRHLYDGSGDAAITGVPKEGSAIAGAVVGFGWLWWVASHLHF